MRSVPCAIAASDGARVLALAGPTASGKSAAALAIAGELQAEIISVDSALVYRGLDIGTAKPTPAERASVPHHLIDIRDPLQAYSAAEFAADATALIAQINDRAKTLRVVAPISKLLACGDIGVGAMAEVDAVVAAVESMLTPK